MYCDSHVEFTHHPKDVRKKTSPFLNAQISPNIINKVKPDLLFLAVSVFPTKNDWEKMLWVIDSYLKTIEENKWTLILEHDDLKKIGIKIILHVEDLGPIGKDLGKIDFLYQLGIRSIGLTHNYANQFAGGALTSAGLTDFGKATVRKIISKNIILDFAHLSEKAFFDIQKEFLLKPFVSHTGLKSCFENPRNASDDILLNVEQNQGYIGIGVAGSFLKRQGASVDNYLEQIQYAQKIAGSKRVGIGSDLGGIVSYLPKGMENLEKTAKLNLSEDILGDNLLRFVKDAI